MEMQRELGVPFRDLMILDPNLPTAYPSSIFIRPRAIVVNLEHIKMIVVSSYALLLNTDSPGPHTRRFVALLKQQLTPRSPAEQMQQQQQHHQQHHQQLQQQVQAAAMGGRIKRRQTDPGGGGVGGRAAHIRLTPSPLTVGLKFNSTNVKLTEHLWIIPQGQTYF